MRGERKEAKAEKIASRRSKRGNRLLRAPEGTIPRASGSGEGMINDRRGERVVGRGIRRSKGKKKVKAVSQLFFHFFFFCGPIYLVS